MAIANTDIEAYALRVANTIGTRVETQVNESINEAVRRIAADVPSARYDRSSSIAINGSYETGTIAITNGSATLTLTGGTWPSWAASGEVMIDGQWYGVSSRDSDSQLTLASSYVGSDLTASSYVIYQDAYAISDDAMETGQDLLYGENWLWGQRPISYDELLRRKQYYTTGNDYPYAWAFANRSIFIWPFPTESALVYYTYRKLPDSVASYGTSVNLDVDDAQLTLLYRAVDVAMKTRGLYHSHAGNPYSEYIEELKRWRRYNGAARSAGPMRNSGNSLREQPRVSGMSFGWPSP